jgi:acetylornithine deacetylase
MIPPIDTELLRSLLHELVAIDSVNPTLVPGTHGEKAAAQFLAQFLRQRGIVAELQEAAPGRPNVLAWLGPPPPIRDGQPCAALAILAHIDTVGPGDMPDPFTPLEKDGRLYGRGALDIKSGVAAMCAAALAIAKNGPAPGRPLLLAAVVDEECNSLGTSALLEHVTSDCAVVLEPTNLQLVVAHKGYAWFEISTHGRAAHGSMPSEGRDAIRMMARVLEKLDAIESSLRARSPHPLLGRASLHASLISGEQELSSYPAECRLQYERRLLPGETGGTAQAEIEEALAQLRAAGAEFSASVRPMGARPAYEISPEAPIARAASSAARAVLGDVQFTGMAPWTDTALLATAGIPGVVFGPSGRGLHGREEFVELASVENCASVLAALISQVCRS